MTRVQAEIDEAQAKVNAARRFFVECALKFAVDPCRENKISLYGSMRLLQELSSEAAEWDVTERARV